MTRTRCPQCGDEIPTAEGAGRRLREQRVRRHLRKRHGWTEDMIDDALGEPGEEPGGAEGEAKG
jgi:hypothetical protein